MHDAFSDDRFACDDYVNPPFKSYHRSIDVAASPPVTFRWLCELKTASYSYGDSGSGTLTPGAAKLAVGQPFLVFEIPRRTHGAQNR